MNFLLVLVISSTRKILLYRDTCPTRRLIKKLVVIFDLPCLVTVLNAVSGVDHVGE